MPPQIVHLAGFGPMPAHVAKTFLASLFSTVVDQTAERRFIEAKRLIEECGFRL